MCTILFPTNRFYPSKVQKTIKELFDDRLKGVDYDIKTANQLCERLIAELREKIKRGMNYDLIFIINVIAFHHFLKEVRIPRYKIGIQLVMGEIKG